MAEIQTRVPEGEPLTPKPRNLNKAIVGGIVFIGLAVLAGALFIPRGEIQAEMAANNPPLPPPVTTSVKTERGQVLAGKHGTTIIRGNVGQTVGLNVSLQEIVAARSANAYPELIHLRGVEVQTVPGDQVFSVGISPANSVLVKIEEPTEPGNLGENGLVIRKGQKVAITGTVSPIKSMGELKDFFGVTGYEAGKLGNTSLVIRAQTVQILED